MIRSLGPEIKYFKTSLLRKFNVPIRGDSDSDTSAGVFPRGEGWQPTVVHIYPNLDLALNSGAFLYVASQIPKLSKSEQLHDAAYKLQRRLSNLAEKTSSHKFKDIVHTFKSPFRVVA